MAENNDNIGCSQRDSAEHEGYAKARRSFNRIWKERDSAQKPKTKARNLIKMGVPEDLAYMDGNSRRGHWFTTQTVAVNMAMTKERLINSGFFDLATAYQSVHVNY